MKKLIDALKIAGVTVNVEKTKIMTNTHENEFTVNGDK